MTDAMQPGPKVAIADISVRGDVADAAFGRRLAVRIGEALAARPWDGNMKGPRTFDVLRLRIPEGADDAQLRAALERSVGGANG